jgi:hypothetical protein
MATSSKTKKGLREIQADRRLRTKFIIAAWVLGIFLVAFTGFAVYLAITFTNRLFESRAPDTSSLMYFNTSDAMKIRRLEHLWTTPSP